MIVSCHCEGLDNFAREALQLSHGSKNGRLNLIPRIHGAKIIWIALWIEIWIVFQKRYSFTWDC